MNESRDASRERGMREGEEKGLLPKEGWTAGLWGLPSSRFSEGKGEDGLKGRLDRVVSKVVSLDRERSKVEGGKQSELE